MPSTTIIRDAPRAAAPPRRALRWRRRWLLAVPALLIAAVAIAVAAHLLDEPLRQRLEATLNERMQGYTVRLPALDFHPLGFSLTLHQLSVRQSGHPEPPVLVVEALHAGVHWRALLHLRLVADFALDSPRVHVNRAQFQQEANDSVGVEDKGWQEALEAIYPLKINQFRIADGELTYVDDDANHPLQITRASFLATNIRNVKSPERTYPSPIHLDAVVFDRSPLRVDGDANFLAVPRAGVRADVELHDVALQRLKPVAVHANVHISGGTLSELLARIEYAPHIQDVHVQRVRISDVAVDYVHSPQTEAAEAQRLETVKTKAGELAERQTVSATIDELKVRGATLGYVDQTRPPGYRMFLSGTDIDLRGFTNRSDREPAHLNVTGYLMGSGKSQLEASFLPRQKDPNLELSIAIEPTDMRAMNDLLRSYGDFDVVGGRFSFYSQLEIKGRKINGYVKPLFSDMNVYDRRQDRDKPVLQQVYEGLVGGLAALLQNRRAQVATQASVRGDADAPEMSTWEVVVNLVRNAFFKAIVPGFEHALREAGSPPRSAETDTGSATD